MPSRPLLRLIAVASIALPLGGIVESERQRCKNAVGLPLTAGARCDAVVANVLAELRRRGLIGPG